MSTGFAILHTSPLHLHCTGLLSSSHVHSGGYSFVVYECCKYWAHSSADRIVLYDSQDYNLAPEISAHDLSSVSPFLTQILSLYTAYFLNQSQNAFYPALRSLKYPYPASLVIRCLALLCRVASKASWRGSKIRQILKPVLHRHFVAVLPMTASPMALRFVYSQKFVRILYRLKKSKRRTKLSGQINPQATKPSRA